MSNELELLRRAFDLPASGALDGARRRLAAEMDAEQTAPVAAPHAPPWYRRRWLAAPVVAAVAALVVLLVELPGPVAVHKASVKSGAKATKPPLVPAGGNPTAQLDQLARLTSATAAVQPTAQQLLFTESRVGLTASLWAAPDESGPPATTGTVALTVRRWTDAHGHSCVAVDAQPFHFATPAAQAAWTAMNLRTTPVPDPIDECGGPAGAEGNYPDLITGDGGLLDVSGLSTSPAALAAALQNGTTGLASIDNLRANGAAADVAFERAAVLLAAPTSGDTAAVDSALLQALALLPGTVALGTTSTHGGAAGVGFAAGTAADAPAVVLDPTDGRLLEVRNLQDVSALTTLAPDYLEIQPTLVKAYSATVQWLDPTQAPTLVAVDQLPADEPATIIATARPDVAPATVDAFDNHLQQQFGTANAGQWFTGAQSNPAASTTVQWSFSDATTQFNEYLRAARSSGLFITVDAI